jgi:GNAT superfamily N-acetyltransferase
MALRLRSATSDDAASIHALILDLAHYVKKPHEVACTVEDLRSQLEWARPPFECVLARWDERVVGFALFFTNYSTWRGRPGLYLEDLFVVPTHRHKGIGRALLGHLGTLAVERGCARLEWAVLDWNEPAIAFYRSLGAERQDDFRIFRLTGEALGRLGSAEG